QSGCKKPIEAERARLSIRDKADNTKDKVVFVWSRGADTTLADYGDPVTGTTGHTLCVYDETAGTPAKVISATAPAAEVFAGYPSWKALSKGSGYVYRNRYASVNG